MRAPTFASRVLVVGGAALWAGAFAWHPVLLDPAGAAHALRVIAGMPRWSGVHLAAAGGLAAWSLGLGLRRRGVACLPLAAALALWLALLLAEAVAMPPLARARTPVAALLGGVAWPLGLAVGYVAYALDGVGVVLAAPSRPRWLGAWGRWAGLSAVAVGCAGYFLGQAALWWAAPSAAAVAGWSVALGATPDRRRWPGRGGGGARRRAGGAPGPAARAAPPRLAPRGRAPIGTRGPGAAAARPEAGSDGVRRESSPPAGACRAGPG